MKLAIDIDGCLADFNTGYGELLIQATGENKFPPTWKQDLAAGTYPTTWFWDREAGYTKEQEALVWQKYIQKQGIFWESLGAYPDAAETVRMLNRLMKLGHDIYYVTNRFGLKAKYQTEKWLYGLGMDYPTVILSENKGPLLESLGADFFVDDKLSTIETVAAQYGATQKKMAIYLKDAPYNREGRTNSYKVVSSVKEALKDFDVWLY